MKFKSVLSWKIILWVVLLFTTCSQGRKEGKNSQHQTNKSDAAGDSVLLKDYGQNPVVLDIDAYTLSNQNFRTALWTGNNLQVTLMSIPVGGEIGLEQHLHTEQFLRVEEGEGKVMMGDSKDSLSFVKMIGKDFAVFVPAGKWHNILNTGNIPLKVYSIYSPSEHPHGTIHHTLTEAELAEHHH